SFLLGTDQLGRDVAAGLAHGARTSLLLALLATFVSLCVGTLLGCLSGYYGGWVDQLLMRITEFFQTIPSFVFAIVLVAIMQPSIESIVIAIAVVTWPPIARLVRGEMLTIRRREFVEACICLGMRDAQIIFREILPNILSPIIVTGSLMVATAILIESALAFLGLGDPNIMSWGFMIGAGRSFLRDAWWLCAIPGLAILLTVLSINLIGEGLNDALNPRLRKM
ncbi:MAG: ABC transporter permease, partial [Burkholderiaceae bacterium]